MEVAKLNQTELQTQLALYCPEISGDNKFIETWTGTSIKKLSEEEFKKAINLCIAEVCMLTGLETYDPEKQKEMFVAQMRSIAKFIFNGFGFLTADEITNAFHLNLQGKYEEIYKQYGIRQINCEFIGQVLNGYRKYKQAYVNLNPDLLKIIYPDPVQKKIEIQYDPTNDDREMIEREYQSFLHYANWNCHLLLDCVYARLVADDFIRANFWETFHRKSKISLIREKNMTKMIPSAVDKNRIGQIITKHYDNHIEIENEIHQIRNGVSPVSERRAKQMAVAGYFKYCLSKGDKNIYVRDGEA